MNAPELKAEILLLTREYSAQVHAANLPAVGPSSIIHPQFSPGSPVPYAGRCFDGDEVAAAVSSALDFWLTLGKEGEAFETEFAQWLGVHSSLLTNSGSSANLLAIATLTSHKLGAARLKPGDEVITAAAGFPTTVSPILQHGLVPVFVDSDPHTLNPTLEHISTAFVPGKTKAVFLAHTLGNPFDLAGIGEFCKVHGLYLIEDNCDALGSRYAGRLTGTFGDLSTQSFYPPHHITLGEGGAVNFPSSTLRPPSSLRKLAESFRDWGRDCWCASGCDNTCHKRYGWQLGDLPAGYDHKHTFSHIGYNLKPLDISAAIGRQQLKKLDAFTQARRRNWEFLRHELGGLGEYFDFQKATPNSEPSWFGFMMLVKPSAPFTRAQLARHLEEKKIGNRMLFGGNLVRQPAFTQLLSDNPLAFRVSGELTGADRIMNDALFVGAYPGLTREMLHYIANTIQQFCKERGIHAASTSPSNPLFKRAEARAPFNP